jgi:microcystin-dependent protein
MAYQSQTYSNNNSGYYIQGAPVINPSSISALVSPVEFLFNSTIQGPYFGSVTQSLSTFTLAENETSGLSTINALIMNPAQKVTQMFVRDKTNVADQPIIQQWTPVSTIVNGVFKAGNENLNDEANAYYIQNTSQVTRQGQGDLRQTTSLATNTTRFDNAGNDPFTYIELNQTLQTPKIVTRAFGAFSEITPSTISLSVGTPGGGFTERLFLGYNTSAPFETDIASSQDLRIVPNGGNTLAVTFKTDGTSVFGSTIIAPAVSTLAVNTSTILANVSFIPDLQNVSTIKSNTSIVNAKFNTDGTSQFLSTLTAPTASVPEMLNVSSINARPISDYIITVPIGTIINWVGNIAGGGQFIPPGYLLCDGGIASAVTYAALYAVIGNTFGAQPTPTTFRLPDTRGRTLMGSLTVGNSVGSNGEYTVYATFQQIVTVNLPASWGGGTRAVWAITNVSGQIFVGMTVTAGTTGPFTAKVVGFINSDGLYGNTIPVNINNVTKAYIYVIFETGAGVGPAGGPGSPIAFGPAGPAAYPLYPLVGNVQPEFFPGAGNYFSQPQDFNTPNHTHVIAQPGSSALTGSGQRAGDWNVGGAPPTSNPQQTFSYTDPGTSAFQTGPAAIYNLPYNFAMWQLIKAVI